MVITARASSVSHVSWVKIPAQILPLGLKLKQSVVAESSVCRGKVVVLQFKDMLDEHGPAVPMKVVVHCRSA